MGGLEGVGGSEIIYTWKVLEKMPVASESLQENQELFRRLYSDARENISVAFICHGKNKGRQHLRFQIFVQAEHSPRQRIHQVYAV